jgi:phosphate transport system permease protein
LYESLFNRAAIEQTAAANYPNGDLEFRSWVSFDFLTSPASSNATITGLRTALIGSLSIILITLIVALPLGVAAAIYLEEYADDRWYNQLIGINIRNLAGVPSIIYGLLGLAVFVRALEYLTSGRFVGITDSNGRTVISAALTLALLILPVIIISAQEAIRAVPRTIREGSYGIGATKWQTVQRQVLPAALPGIMTGLILAISRAIGETAPLVAVGASTFLNVDPSGPFSKFTVVPIQIYQWTSRPEAEFKAAAGGAIIVLMVLLLLLNGTAIIIRQRFSRRLQ